MMNGFRLTRSIKEWVVALLVPGVIFVSWWSVSEVNQRSDQTRLTVVCQIEEQNIQQLRALKQIATELGIPGNFIIPARTTECEELASP
jgi:hypothetical protein